LTEDVSKGKPGIQPSSLDRAPWAALADILLRRAALVARVAFDHRPDPLAGLKVDDEDLGRLLTELPGLGVADHTVIDAIHREAGPSVAAARARLHSEISGSSIFGRIVRFARLSPLEAEVLATACAVELDPRRQRVVGYLNDDVSQRRLTLFTLALIFPEHPDVVLAAGPGGGLRRAALLAPAEPGPLSSTVVSPAPTVVWWLAGDRTPDGDLPPGTALPGTAGPPGPVIGPPGQWSPAGEPSPRLVLVPASDRVRRHQAAEASLGPLLRAPLPATAGEWDALVRQATLEERAILLELSGPLTEGARQRITQASHLSWALSSPEELPLDCLPPLPWQELAVAPAPATEAEVAEAVAGLPDPPGPAMAQSLNLSAEQLELVRQAIPGVGGDLAAAARRLAAGHISALAPRIRPSRTWDDIVLDGERTERLHEVVARCRHRKTVFGAWGFSPLPSAGVVVLFSGPSGTGKTLAAEIIAGELGLDLYKVDLAALVSKWVGETEKNLQAVFAAAEASNVALFFDEADAIFGKRSEVSDAQDRYANIEVAYLLQRLERYDGLVVLATNLATNIDPAFLRRITVSVDFPMPEEAERQRIWERSLPPGAPCHDLDLALLAKLFKLSGGSIRNAALTAGFLAADSSRAITMEVVIEAVQREMRKLGRLLTPAEFGPYAGLVGQPRGTRTAAASERP
jgi:SpoVK/Ycf46/Vps4 family AAA+-type ATPase